MVFPSDDTQKLNTMDLELALKKIHLKIKFWTNYMDKNIFYIIVLIHEKWKSEVAGNEKWNWSSFFVHSEWNAEGRQTKWREKLS